MANKTQMRLQMVTGSLTDIQSSVTSIAAGKLVSLLSATEIPNTEKMLTYYAQAIANIHGNTNFGAVTPGDYKYNSGAGVLAFRPDTDGAMVLGGGVVGSWNSASGISSSDISDSTLLLTATSISLGGSNTMTASEGSLISFENSAGKRIAFKLTAALSSGASSMSVVGLPEVSEVGTLGKSSVSAIKTASSMVANEWKNVRTQKIETDSTLTQKVGNVWDGDAASIDFDATGGVAIDSSAGSVTVGAILADGQTLKLGKSGAVEVNIAPHGTPANELYSVTNTAGTADNAIELDAVAGGIKLEAAKSIHLESEEAAADSVQLSAKHDAGGIDLMVGASPLAILSLEKTAADFHSTAIVNVNNVTDASAVTAAALVVDGGLGVAKKVFIGDDIDGAGNLTLDKSNVNIRIGSGAHQLDEDSTGLLLKAVGSSKKLVAQAAQSDVQIKAGSGLSSPGAVYMSGSSGLEFASDGGFSFSGHSTGGVLLMDAASEAATYRSNFSNSTSIMAAINSLKSMGTPTLWRRVHTGADISAGAAVALTKVAGDATSFSLSLKENEADVYVNGQLLVSGSESARSGGTADYNLGPAVDQIKFAFAIEHDDIITLVDRT